MSGRRKRLISGPQKRALVIVAGDAEAGAGWRGDPPCSALDAHNTLKRVDSPVSKETEKKQDPPD
jgi:hypothetical protein